MSSIARRIFLFCPPFVQQFVQLCFVAFEVVALEYAVIHLSHIVYYMFVKIYTFVKVVECKFCAAYIKYFFKHKLLSFQRRRLDQLAPTSSKV